MNSAQISEVLNPVVAQFGLELDAVEVKPAGKRTVVRVVVDGDGPDGTGPSLDGIAEATRAVTAALDSADITGAGSYTLEVSSRGVSRPLTLPRHWRRNNGRLVTVTLTSGAQLTGRITGSTDHGVGLDVDGTDRELAYDEIGSAVVQIELNRKPRPGGATRPGKEN